MDAYDEFTDFSKQLRVGNRDTIDSTDFSKQLRVGNRDTIESLNDDYNFRMSGYL